MRPGLSGLLFLCACQGPYQPFDAGHAVRFILAVDPAPRKPLAVRPVCTVGGQVEKPRKITITRGAPNVEVARIVAPAGRHRIAVFEARSGVGGRQTRDVDGDLWVVLDLPAGRLRVFDRPPDSRIGRIRPLVAVPD